MTKLETQDGTVYNIEEEVSEEELQAQETVDGLLAQFGNDQDVEVYIYRLHKDKTKGYICQMSASEFSLDMLRDKYKGGRFDILIKSGGKLVKSRRISVEPPLEDSQSIVASTGASDIQQMIFTMMQQDKQRSDDLLKVLLAKETPKPNYNMPELITAIATVLPHLKSFFGKASTGNEFEILMKGLELGKSLQGETAEKSLTDVMFKGVDALAKMLPAQSGQTSQAQPTTQQEVAQEQTPQIEVQQTEQQIMINIMKQRLAPLIEAAKNNEDPYPYALLIFNKVPMNYIEEWVIKQDDPLVKLIEIEPQINNYKDWFTRLAEIIKEEYKADLEEGGEQQPE